MLTLIYHRVHYTQINSNEESETDFVSASTPGVFYSLLVKYSIDYMMQQCVIIITDLHFSNSQVRHLKQIKSVTQLYVVSSKSLCVYISIVT